MASSNQRVMGRRRRGAGAETYYEYRTFTIPRSVSRGTPAACSPTRPSTAGGSLARTRVYLGGNRKVWLRRKAMRVESTL